MRLRTPFLVILTTALATGARLHAAQAQPKLPRRPTVKAHKAGGGEAKEESPEPFETGLDYKPTPPRARVTFNLEDADLPDLVRLISQITGRRFILSSKLRQLKASVYAPTKVSAAEAYQAFLSILELNGMNVEPAGRYLKIVESKGIEHRPISLYKDGMPVPGGDRFVTHLKRPKHVSADDVAQVLGRFKSAEGNVTAYAPTNLLIITDTGTNVRRMMTILNAIDVPRTGEQIWIEPVHYADASELASRLSEIFPPSDGKPASRSSSTRRPRPSQPQARGRKPPQGQQSGTIGQQGHANISKILADERTNSLILVATEAAYLRILETLRHLDVALPGEGRVHVHYLQHGDSDEIASTLGKLVGQSRSGSTRRGRPPTPSPGGGQAGAFEGEISVTAHKETNALVISSSMHDYAALRSVIEQLDIKRRQVFIEAVILELSVNRSRKLGFKFHTGIPNVAGVDGALAGVSVNGIASVVDAAALTGLAVGVQGPPIEEANQILGFSLPGFGVALTALASSGDANILATPHLIAMDNVEAEISIGQNVPLQTSGFGGLGGLGSLAGLAGGAQGQQANPALGAMGAMGAMGGLGGLGMLGGLGSPPRQDVGTTIRVTPHINESDEIRLEIQEEISEASAPSQQGNLGVVSIAKTQAKTEVVVRDQQTVVIGGLIRDTVRRNESKVPILGDIPLLGALFRTTDQTTEKRNLLMFLTPYIIRAPSDLRTIYERKMRERQEFLDRYFVFGDSDYEPPVDYSRTRGLVGEILLELRAIDEKRSLLEEGKAKPVREHKPRPPIGEMPVSADGQVVVSTPETLGPPKARPAPRLAPTSPRRAVQSPIPEVE